MIRQYVLHVEVDHTDGPVLSTGSICYELAESGELDLLVELHGAGKSEPSSYQVTVMRAEVDK